MAASRAARRLKAEWTKLPACFFEVMTLGEIKVGQKFTFLPGPGDNNGHGGFRGSHWCFIKTYQKPGGTKYNPLIPNVLNISNGNESSFPDSMAAMPLLI
jgi:hypothetical protein